MNYIREILSNYHFYLDNQFKLRFLFIFILTLLASVIELLGVASLPLLVGLFLENSASPYLEEIKNYIKIEKPILFVSIVILFIFIFKNFFLAFVYYIENVFGKDLNIFLKHKLYKGYLSLPYSYYLNDNPSIFTRNILDDTENVNWYFNVINILLREIITVIFLTSYLIFSDVKTTMSLLIFFSVITYLFYYIIKNKISYFIKNDLFFRKQQLQSLTQSFETIEIIKILKKSDFFETKFKEFTGSKEKFNFYINFLNRLPRLILELAAIFAIVMVIFQFIYYDYNSKDFIPYLTLLIICIIRFIPAFTAITNSLVIIRKVKVSVDRVKNKINEINKNNIKYEEDKKNKNFEFSTNKKIEIKKINFFYNNGNKVLDNLSFSIEENDSVALIGPSGSGKSTLIKNLLGLLKPKNGEILYNNQNIYKNIASWHGIISYIPQKIYLLDDTIKNNIAFGVEENDINEEKLDNVIKLSNLKSFINNLKNNINTNVGNQGSNISGGQLQRIGIARALYSAPKILIMDEATNSLDEETEKKVIESINNINQIKIKIIISHRQSTVNSCNKIYLLDKGNIKQIK